MRCQPALRNMAAASVLVFGLALTACSPSTTTPQPTPADDAEETDDLGEIGDADDAKDAVKSEVDAGKDVDVVIEGPCENDEKCALLTDADACKVGRCNAATKKCEAQIADDGAACSDGKACTTADKCTGGSCAGSEAGACPEKSCQIASCAADGACEYVKAPSGTPCDDGDLCSQDDKCAAGTCASGGVKTCDDNNPCTTDSCDAKTGCVSVPNAGKACDDENACSAGDVCDAVGLCNGPTPVACDDGNPCTTDSCSPAKGCQFAAVTTALACKTGDLCQDPNGVCSGKVCKGKVDPLIDDQNDCTLDACKVVNGKKDISHVAQSGQGCDDGDPCSKGDTCNTQADCKGTALVCNDGNPCTSDVCDPKKTQLDGNGKPLFGFCEYTSLANGATCTDGNACTTLDACAEGACKGKDYQTTGQCDDKNDCTNDSCQPGGGCVHTPKDGQFCNDGDVCTNIDKCSNSVCKGVAKDCKDSNACTTDKCDAASGNCTHAEFKGPCDDGDACTQNDVCEGGVCDGSKINCDDGNPCTNDICDTQKGCVHVKASGGTPCDDGLSCTTGQDYCDNGACVPLKDTCPLCNGDVECKQYDDNNFCTGIVKCITGHPTKPKVCAVDTKTVVKCDAGNDGECAKNTCNPDSGSCSVILKNEGAPCSGGDKCVDNATCTASGSCVGVVTVCDDKNPCTDDSCDKLKGCVYKAKLDATTCDDKNVCTPTSACQAGQCVGSENTCFCNNDTQCTTYDDGDFCNGLVKCLPDPKGGAQKLCQQAANSAVTCPALDNKPCQSNACDAKSGQCVAQAKNDGTSCNDQNACTVGETCAAGACSSKKQVDCGDGNLCTVDVCDKVFGCANAPTAKGGLCDDGDGCTKTDNCDENGNCVGTKLNCDDGNPCTIDLCDKTKGCKSLIEDGSVCDDGDPCTLKDACTDGKCVGAALNCDDKNSCTVDACDGKGGCKNVLIEGKDCTDGDNCTVADTCVAGQCVGKVKSCDDNNPCTQDACTNGSCVITPAVSQACDDGNACTYQDSCDLKGTCAGKILDCKTDSVCLVNLSCSPVTGCTNVTNDGKPCSDNDSCTIGDTCAGGGCQGVKLNCNDNDVCTADKCDPKIGCQISQNLCDDLNPCTIDTCDKVKGCKHEVVEGSACDDGNKCHEQGQCSGGSCVTKGVKCDDKNGCTLDSCDAKVGCVFLAGEDTKVTCDDNNPCTKDTCDAGKCAASATLCDDGNPCTVDSCDPLKGCVVTDAKEAAACDDGDGCTANTKCQGGFCSGGSVTCGKCDLDKDCDAFDATANNKCDGTYTCKMDKIVGFKLCIPLPEPVTCDTSTDTACSKNACNPASGKCQATEVLNGTQCEDGKGCTVGDTCTGGKCVAGQPNACTGVKDACNDAKCVEDATNKNGFACVALPKQDSSVCDADGSGCTANDFCAQGKCIKGAAVDCTGVAKVCEVATCKSTGATSFSCAVALAADNTACDDGQLCTEGDFCKNGKCTAGTKPHDCSGVAGTCATGFCDKAGNAGTGACVPQAQNEGKACDADGNGCTTSDKCISGSCVPGLPPDCDAQAGACTTGACKSNDAGTYQCIGAPKAEKLPCEADNDGCTFGDACISGKCTAGVKKDCSSLTSKDGCQVGTCKSLGSSQNTCVIAPAPIGQTCNSDDNGCTKGDICNKDGACIPGPAVDCLAFGGSCSTGVCGSTGASTFTCSGTAKQDGTACDGDLNGCTVSDKCKAGKCIPGPAPDCSAKAGTNVCLVGKCLNSGSDKYQCDAASVTDNTPCDKDSDGCTVDDSCQLGFCTAGDLQTCSSFASLCGDVKCDSTGTNAYKCAVTPKESYPPIDPPVACTTTDSPDKCDAGYTCLVQNATTKAGLCTPKATVYCDDKDLCTQSDVCVAGKCTAGIQKDCDDKDPCTLDACKAGKCSNTVVAGCVACVNEAFDPSSSKNWVALSADPTYVSWLDSDKNPYAGNGHLRATWKGPPTVKAASPTVVASYRYRRLYVESSQTAQMDFNLAMTVSTQECGYDDFSVWINGVQVLSRCANTDAAKLLSGSKYEHVVIDLSAYVGSHVDMELRAVAGVDTTSSGTIDVDSVRVTGACGPGCLGVNFEPGVGVDADGQPTMVMEEVLPQTVVTSASTSGYMEWKANVTGGHTLIGDMQAKYAGNPPGGAAQTATLTVKSVRPIPGDKLWFAVKSTGVADTGCTGDDLVVTLGGKEIYKRCDSTNNWKMEAVDLAAFASQTVDLVFTVTSGKSSTSGGTFEVDDIAVAGNCTYACFHETFDTMTEWTTTSSNALNFKPWTSVTANPAPPASPPKVAFAGFDKSTNPGIVLPAISSAHAKKFVAMSVLGATYSYNLNLFTGGAACEKSAKFALRALINLTPATKATQLDKDADGNITFSSSCKSTSGWTDGPYVGELDTRLLGARFKVSMALGATADSTVGKAFVDDLTLMCR